MNKVKKSTLRVDEAGNWKLIIVMKNNIEVTQQGKVLQGGLIKVPRNTKVERVNNWEIL